jgi:preprotein translocase subunit SecG
VFNALFVPLLNAVPLVFVIRTISLYTFDKRVCIPLLVAYAVCFGVSLSALPFWGVNLDIPGSDGWCVYDTRRQERTPYNAAWRSEQPRLASCFDAMLTLFAAGCGMLLDLTVILLTLHRLTEGGLGAVFRRKDRQQISASRLSATLLRQGFQYFVLIFVTDVLFLALYWSQPPSRVPFQVAGSAVSALQLNIAAASR